MSASVGHFVSGEEMGQFVWWDNLSLGRKWDILSDGTNCLPKNASWTMVFLHKCRRYAQKLPKIYPRYAWDTRKLCPRYGDSYWESGTKCHRGGCISPTDALIKNHCSTGIFRETNCPIRQIVPLSPRRQNVPNYAMMHRKVAGKLLGHFVSCPTLSIWRPIPWAKVAHLGDMYWTYLGYILTTFWLQSAYILATFLLHFELSGFGKYSSLLWFQLFSWCFCLCRCLCLCNCLCLCICVPLPFLNSH